ncbi:1588_t:CDS:1, partial [Rhizophagus irregularis]
PFVNMLRKKFSYKDTNKQFTIRNHYSHIPQANDYIGNTVNSRLIYSTIKEPILNHSRRANLSTNEIDNIYN